MSHTKTNLREWRIRKGVEFLYNTLLSLAFLVAFVPNNEWYWQFVGIIGFIMMVNKAGDTWGYFWDGPDDTPE